MDGQRDVSFAAGQQITATSTQRDGGDHGGRCWCTCVSVCPSVRLLDGVWWTNGQTKKRRDEVWQIWHSRHPHNGTINFHHIIASIRVQYPL